MPAEMLKPFGLLALPTACAAAFLCNSARADDDSLWVTTGLRSWHTNESQMHFRQNNDGIGLSFEMPGDINVVAGTYMNSDNRRSNYFGVMYQPLNLGGVHIGILGGVVGGYSLGKLTVAVIPMASYEYKWVGINLFWYPGILTAAQLKVRIAEF